MTAQKVDLIISPDQHREPNAATRLRVWWSAVTVLLAGGIFVQAGFAGGMLSGFSFAHSAHAMTAGVLTAATFISGLVALVSLRGIENGRKLGWTLLALAAAIFIQTVIGKLSAEGANLMWVHVPLGVALVGLAAKAATRARTLGGA